MENPPRLFRPAKHLDLSPPSYLKQSCLSRWLGRVLLMAGVLKLLPCGSETHMMSAEKTEVCRRLERTQSHKNNDTYHALPQSRCYLVARPQQGLWALARPSAEGVRGCT